MIVSVCCCNVVFATITEDKPFYFFRRLVDTSNLSHLSHACVVSQLALHFENYSVHFSHTCYQVPHLLPGGYFLLMSVPSQQFYVRYSLLGSLISTYIKGYKAIHLRVKVYSINNQGLHYYIAQT